MARKMTEKQSLFFEPTSPKLAKIIDITSPESFAGSIKEIKKGGVTVKEKRALVLAQNRSKAQLKRKNLSAKEHMEFREIAEMELPDVTMRSKKKVKNMFDIF